MIRYYDDDGHGSSFDPDDERGHDVESRDLGTATIVKETKLAFLVLRDNMDELWLPRSVVHDDSEVYSMKSCGPGKLVVHAWWAEENGVE